MKPTLEQLESRLCPSTNLAPLPQLSALFAQAEALVQSWQAHLLSVATPAAGGTTPGGYSPAQIAHAYGFDKIFFQGGIPGNGAGQTIAIVDAYHAPNLASDLHAFDVQFGLPDPPSLTILDQKGGVSYPSVDPTGSWGMEASLDVQWAHAMAPAANIVLVEANSAGFADLFLAVNTAAHLPAVSVVSMSWLGAESPLESVLDKQPETPK